MYVLMSDLADFWFFMLWCELTPLCSHGVSSYQALCQVWVHTTGLCDLVDLANLQSLVEGWCDTFSVVPLWVKKVQASNDFRIPYLFLSIWNIFNSSECVFPQHDAKNRQSIYDRTILQCELTPNKPSCMNSHQSNQVVWVHTKAWKIKNLLSLGIIPTWDYVGFIPRISEKIDYFCPKWAMVWAPSGDR
jgi:hypothetical protein